MNSTVTSWVPLSKNEAAPALITNTQGAAVTALQDTYNSLALADNPNAKISIGTLISTPGILVLEDSNKAMVLPKVESPHLYIVNPEPGTMVYDT